MSIHAQCNFTVNMNHKDKTVQLSCAHSWQTSSKQQLYLLASHHWNNLSYFYKCLCYIRRSCLQGGGEPSWTRCCKLWSICKRNIHPSHLFLAILSRISELHAFRTFCFRQWKSRPSVPVLKHQMTEWCKARNKKGFIEGELVVTWVLIWAYTQTRQQARSHSFKDKSDQIAGTGCYKHRAHHTSSLLIGWWAAVIQQFHPSLPHKSPHEPLAQQNIIIPLLWQSSPGPFTSVLVFYIFILNPSPSLPHPLAPSLPSWSSFKHRPSREQSWINTGTSFACTV